MRVAIVGGGVAGMSAALSCAQKGIEVHVFERSMEAHPGLWVTFAHSSVRVAKALGIWDELFAIFEKAQIKFLEKFKFVDSTNPSRSTSSGSPYGSLVRLNNLTERYGEPVSYTIPRHLLYDLLHAKVAEKPELIHLVRGAIVSGVRETDEGCFLSFEGEDKKEQEEQKFDLVIAADGSWSICKAIIAAPATPAPLVELNLTLQGMARFPPGDETYESFVREHETDFLVGLHPLFPGVVTRIDNNTICFVFGMAPSFVDPILEREGEASPQKWQGAKRVPTQRWKELVLEKVKDHKFLHSLIFHTDPTEMRTFRLRLTDPVPRRSYSLKRRVVAIGDALHTVNPFVGWGLNLAFQDGFTLAQELAVGIEAKSAEPWKLAVERYDNQQRPLWEAFLDQSKKAANHFGKFNLTADRVVLSMLPDNVLQANYDKVIPRVAPGENAKPLRPKYCGVCFLILACIIGLAVGLSLGL